MTKKQPPLTSQQRQDCAACLPEAIRAAVMGVSLTGLDVALTGVQPEELCHPLTAEQLRQIRACASYTRREMDIRHIPGVWEDEGMLIFRVGYDIAGYDADGNAFAVQAEGAVGLRCAVHGGGYFRQVLTISDVERCTLLPEGGVRRPGRLKRSLRRWLRRRNRASIGETAGELLLEVLGEALGAVVEIVLEVFSDG